MLAAGYYSTKVPSNTVSYVLKSVLHPPNIYILPLSVVIPPNCIGLGKSVDLVHELLVVLYPKISNNL